MGLSDGREVPACRDCDRPAVAGCPWCRQHDPDRCTGVTTLGRRCTLLGNLKTGRCRHHG